MTIYFDTKTGNVQRFVDKLMMLDSSINVININDIDHESFDAVKGHLISYTTGSGFVPVTTSYFMQRFYKQILSVSSSGNRNWGANFAKCATILSEQYLLPICLKFELSGMHYEVEEFLDYVQDQNRSKANLEIL